MAWRSSGVIRRCVKALRSDPSIDKIIVVNNSPEDPVEVVLSGCERVILLNPGSNLGFGSGVNLAQSRVTQPFVVIANPDAFQSNDTTTRLIEFLYGKPRAALVGPRTIRPDGTMGLNSQYDLSLWRIVGHQIHPSIGVTRTLRQHATAHETECVIAAFVVARVEALDAIGWFDSSIFMFGEDQDLCRRLRRAGWQIWYSPDGSVEHMSGHSWRQDLRRSTELLREARYRELYKAHGAGSARAYRGLRRLWDGLNKWFRT